MHYFRALTAIIHGLKFCFFVPAVRKLAVWPWLIGAVCYLLSLFGVYHYHSRVLHWMVNDPHSFLSGVIYYGAWLLVTLLMLMGSVLFSVSMVAIFGSVFQTAVARAVLAAMQVATPEEAGGIKATVAETTRTIAVETKKLLWLLPLMLLVFIIGLFPLFTPIAIVLGSWVLAYQFIDLVLDIYKIRVRKRLSFALARSPLVIAFGLTLSACWAVPFLGIFLAPAAAAGAAWLFSHEALQSEIRELSVQ